MLIGGLLRCKRQLKCVKIEKEFKLSKRTRSTSLLLNHVFNLLTSHLSILHFQNMLSSLGNCFESLSMQRSKDSQQTGWFLRTAW